MAEHDVEPFRMIGNVHYVGTRRVSSHLFTSDEGHILLDACFPGDGPVILDNIRALGFEPKDVCYLLITHTHLDHCGGAAHIKRETSAEVRIGEADVEPAQKGSDTEMGLIGFEPFEVDAPLHDGDVVSVGPTSVTVYHTPGHTPGCSSFGFEVQEDGCALSGMLFGGPGLNVFDPEKVAQQIYGGALEDFIASVKRLLAMEPDVWLGAHPGQNKTFDKAERLQAGERPNPFIDPEGWRAYLTARLAAAEKLL